MPESAPSKGLWTGYLAETVFKPKYLMVFLIPSIVAYVIANTFWSPNDIQMLFIMWGAWHLSDAILLAWAPVDFGLKLYFPALADKPNAQALALIRFVLCLDLLFAVTRFMYGLYPESGPLLVVTAATALVQGILGSLEARSGHCDQRTEALCWFGALVLIVAMIRQVSQHEISF